ncbi:hypothetical protein [uncultured Novosphingobium sp.]|nr:hypothetical protein [uncultured Novosphingobium sp.]
MREAFDQWDFVIAAYAVGVIGTALMIAWAWLTMRRAEQRRDESRKR